MPNSMKALVLVNPGSPPQLEVRDVPVPEVPPGEVLVKVEACGFCHHDFSVMSGGLRRGVKPDLILGHEIAGTVAAVGEGVDTLKEGERVTSLLTSACGRCTRCTSGREHRCLLGHGIGHSRSGGLAEYVCVSEFSLIPIPDSIPFPQAALLACPLGVVLQAIQSVARVKAGETVLVTGAGGGLGSHGVQVAAALGGRVLAVTSSPEKTSALENSGAEFVLEIPPGADEGAGEDFSELVWGLTGDQGADVIVDTVGSPLFSGCLGSLAPYGRWVMLGEVAGRPVALNPAELIFRDAQVFGSSGTSRATVAGAIGMVTEGLVKPLVQEVIPLDQVNRAVELMASREIFGRIVLTAQ